MHAHDEQAFADTLELCFGNYRQPAPKEAVVLDWMRHLEPFNVLQVGSAIEQHKRTSVHPPTLANLIDLLPKNPSDWPTASLAYTEMRQVEGGRFMLVTQEHIAGFEAARPLLEARDRFNAGKAFVERYDVLVTDAKNAGIAAAWFVSNTGSDHEGTYRREAITEGVRTGRIGREQAPKMMSGQMPKPMLAATTDEPAALLAGPSVKEQVERVRAMLKPNYDSKPVRDMSEDISDTKARQAEANRKVEERMALEARERAVAKREAAVAVKEVALGGAWLAARGDAQAQAASVGGDAA